MPASEPIKTFLSCSIRPDDRPLVNAAARRLGDYGFRCFTVGRNRSGAAPPDEVVKRVLLDCECLIGLATVRHDAVDVHDGSNLKLATTYLVAETAGAFFVDIPFVIFYATGVNVQGLPARNIYHEMSPKLSASGRWLVRDRTLMVDALDDLRAQALEVRARRRSDAWKKTAKDLLAVVGAGAVGYAAIDFFGRPWCFADPEEHDLRTKKCRDCGKKAECRAALS